MKILIVDDHGLVREGLRAVLSRSGLEVQCLEAWSAASVHEQLQAHPDTDLVLLDIRLPDASGMDVLSRLTAVHPRLAVMMLSAEYDSDTVRRALDAGASGFLPKSSLNQVLVSAIQLVIAGGVYVPPEALRPEHSPSVRTPEVAPAALQAQGSLEGLGITARQADVLRLLLEGKSNKQICRELDLAEPTVKIHVRGILRSLNASNRAEVIVRAAQLGVLPMLGSAVASGGQ